VASRTVRPPEKGQPTLRFWIARHGQTTYNAADRFQGSLDKESPLTEKGQRQARELGRWLVAQPDAEFGAVYVSSLTRARQTLAIAAEEGESVAGAIGVPWPEGKPLRQMREIDLYEWQGLTKDEVKEQYPDSYVLWKEEPWELELSGHRVLADLFYRASCTWELLLKEATPGKPTLIVAHGGFNKALVCSALGFPMEAWRNMTINNGEVLEVEWLPDDSQKWQTPIRWRLRWRRRHPERTGWTDDITEAAPEHSAVA